MSYDAFVHEKGRVSTDNWSRCMVLAIGDPLAEAKEYCQRAVDKRLTWRKSGVGRWEGFAKSKDAIYPFSASLRVALIVKEKRHA